MALPGKSVHVAINQQSKRLSPAYFAFWSNSNPRDTIPDGHWTHQDLRACSWSFLDAAKSHGNRFPSNVIHGLSPLLETQHGFRRRESLALILRHLVTTLGDGKWKPETADIIFAVEPVLPFEERLAIAEAVQLANATLKEIIDSPTAAATTYALEKRMLYADGPKTVVFIDVGAAHSWASVCRFHPKKDQPEVQVLAVDFNYSLGGNLMNTRIADHLVGIFEKAHSLPVTAERTKKLFYNEGTRVKELLTLNDVVDIKLEEIVDDYGISCRFTRAEFETMISDVAESVSRLYLSVVDKSGLTISDIDSIELLGGVTRVPLIKESLLETSKLAKLNRTMNSDEAIALGAAYVGASKSSSFIVPPVKIRPLVGINVSLQAKGGLRELYAADQRTTEVITIPILVRDLTQYSIVAGANKTRIVQFDVNLPDNATEDNEVVFTIGFNQFLVPDILNATLNGLLLKVRKTYPLGLDLEEFQNSKIFIRRMDRILKERQQLQKKKSDFESYLYGLKSRIEDDDFFRRALTDSEKVNLSEAVGEQLRWFEADDNVTSHTISDRHAAVKAIARSPEIRAEQLSRRAPAMKRLNTTLSTVHTLLNVTWRLWKDWIPKNKTAPVWQLYNSTREWYDEHTKLFEMAHDWDDPVVMDDEINRKSAALERLAKRVNATEKPKPTVVPRLKKGTNTTAVNKTVGNATEVNQTDGNGGNVTTAENQVEESGENQPVVAESGENEPEAEGSDQAGSPEGDL
jgi:molecular chaperone DnaK (HSP70)